MRMARSLLKVLELNTLKLLLLRFFVLRITRSKTQVLESFHERVGSLLEGTYVTEYIELLHSDVVPTVIESVPSAINIFRQFLYAVPAYTSRDWWVSFYFRQEGKSGSDLKDMDPLAYRPAIEHIFALGGRVFCGGDCDPRTVFPDILSLCGYHTFLCDRALTDFFFLTQSRFVVGGHSGPLAVATAFNVPMLITNCPFHYASGYRSNQRIIYKHLKEQATSHLIPASRTFSLPVIAFTRPEQFADAGLMLCDNSPEEILSGVEEIVESVLHKRDNANAGDRILEEQFRSLLPRESAAYRTPCRPTTHYLRHLHLD